VSADEILTAKPCVKYKDILLSKKSVCSDEQSGHSSRLGHNWFKDEFSLSRNITVSD
jgi:hypothetical protein